MKPRLTLKAKVNHDVLTFSTISESWCNLPIPFPSIPYYNRGTRLDHDQVILPYLGQRSYELLQRCEAKPIPITFCGV